MTTGSSAPPSSSGLEEDYLLARPPPRMMIPAPAFVTFEDVFVPEKSAVLREHSLDADRWTDADFGLLQELVFLLERTRAGHCPEEDPKKEEQTEDDIVLYIPFGSN